MAKYTEIDKPAFVIDWVTWMAKDKTGDIYVYATKPRKDTRFGCWCVDWQERTAMIEITDAKDFDEIRKLFPALKNDWEQSLIKLI